MAPSMTPSGITISWIHSHVPQTEDSTSSGWSKNDGSGESVGHDSGRHIVRILDKNPEKDPCKCVYRSDWTSF